MYIKKSNQSGRILRAKNQIKQVNNVNETNIVEANEIESGKNETSGKISVFIWLCLFSIIVCVNHFFSLVPWAKLPGKFNSSDIGLLILIIVLTFLLASGKSKKRLNNGITYIVLLYLLMVVGQVANVSFNFGQSIFDGLVASRHQLYYLSFFVFLMVFENERCIKKFLNFMLLLAVFLSIIGFINYFGFTLYHHVWAEGHGERAGITRAFFAGIGIIAFSLLWVISQWLVEKKINTKREFAGALLIITMVMRQTRGLIIGAFVAIVFMLVNKRKIKTLFIGGICLVLLSITISVYKDTNILLNPFISAYQDISEGGGTWAPRIKQLEDSISTFMEHPVFGGGTYAIRLNLDGKSSMQLRELSIAHANADLGYVHWLKAYGSVGMIWLFALYVAVAKYIKPITGSSVKRMEAVGLLSAGYMIYVMVSFVTSPHFIWANSILLICIALALMVRVRQLNYQS